MRKLVPAVAVIAAAGLAVAPANAGRLVESRTKVVDVSTEAHGKVGVYAILKTRRDCYAPKRTFVLLDEDGPVDRMRGYSDVFFITDEVGVGDVIEVKSKTAIVDDSGERTKCKGSISRRFEIDRPSDAPAG